MLSSIIEVETININVIIIITNIILISSGASVLVSMIFFFIFVSCNSSLNNPGDFIFVNGLFIRAVVKLRVSSSAINVLPIMKFSE